MKRILLILTLLSILGNVKAQELEVIKLNAPYITRGETVMATLAKRHSERSFENKDLSFQDLSDLLWAAVGVNREDGRRTAPTASNKQEIDIYVVMQDGAYLYNAAEHALQPVAQGDHRALVLGRQKYDNPPSLYLVIVADLAKMGDVTAEQTKMMCAVDAGIACQNINIFCAATGLATVPRATMNKEELTKVLKLSDSQYLMVNNAVGYPKAIDN
ncbi:MAG: SagB/ThcOx family dehydrogenase [Tannerella sp.]|jgi:SagB-type dehydrogenase family enzyme|nr:SagB/ThcOx family dehydrogenase [Tannerella sp.]